MEKVDYQGYDWTRLAMQSRIYLYRKMEKENTYWTPIGIYTPDAVGYLVDKKLLEPFVDKWSLTDRFFKWTNVQAWWKWQQGKANIYKSINSDPDHALNKIILFCDDHDYLSLIRTQALPVDRDTSKTALHVLVDLCKDIELEGEDVQIAEIYRDVERLADAIRDGIDTYIRSSKSNEELVEEVFDIHQ